MTPECWFRRTAWHRGEAPGFRLSGVWKVRWIRAPGGDRKRFGAAHTVCLRWAPPHRRAASCKMNSREGRSKPLRWSTKPNLTLIHVENVDWQHRAHFFAVSAQVMRHILLDRARRRVAAKRGGKTPRVNLDEIPDIASRSASELVALDDTFNALAKIDPRKASRACSVD